MSASGIEIFDTEGQLLLLLELTDNDQDGGFKRLLVFDGGEDPVAGFGKSGKKGILVPISKDDIRHLWPNMP